MSDAGSVGGRDSARLFCALRLPEAVLDEIVEWQRAALPRNGVRAVSRENLHATLAFLGRRPGHEVPAIAGALRAVSAAAGRIELLPRAGGAYRETRSVGMLVLRDVHGTATALADSLHDRLEELGVYRREQRPWLPHVTVVRFKRPPRLRPAEPPLGVFSPSDTALYTSVLRPGGAQYEVLESVSLGGG